MRLRVSRNSWKKWRPVAGSSRVQHRCRYAPWRATATGPEFGDRRWEVVSSLTRVWLVKVRMLWFSVGDVFARGLPCNVCFVGEFFPVCRTKRAVIKINGVCQRFSSWERKVLDALEEQSENLSFWGQGFYCEVAGEMLPSYRASPSVSFHKLQFDLWKRFASESRERRTKGENRERRLWFTYFGWLLSKRQERMNNACNFKLCPLKAVRKWNKMKDE